MAVNNSLQKSQKRLGIGSYLTGDAVKQRMMRLRSVIILVANAKTQRKLIRKNTMRDRICLNRQPTQNRKPKTMLSIIHPITRRVGLNALTQWNLLLEPHSLPCTARLQRLSISGAVSAKTAQRTLKKPSGT